MKQWAEIYQSKVVAIHQMPDDLTPVFNPNSFRFCLEITDTDPQPGPGWLYDFDTETFSEPPPTPIDKSGSRAYHKRSRARQSFKRGQTDKALKTLYS